MKDGKGCNEQTAGTPLANSARDGDHRTHWTALPDKDSSGRVTDIWTFVASPFAFVTNAIFSIVTNAEKGFGSNFDELMPLFGLDVKREAMAKS